MEPGYTGNQIAKLRKQKGLTQRELAETLHVTVSAVSKWERGLNFPDLSLMEPLAALLGTTVAVLFGLEDESADRVIRDMTKLSRQEFMGRRQKERKNFLVVFLAMLIFVGASYLALQLVGRDALFQVLFGDNGTMIYNLLALILGLTAWIFALCGILRREMAQWKNCSIISWACCAAALYLPILITDLTLRFDYYGTLEDTIGGYDFAAIVLLLGTILLNATGWLTHWQRPGTGTTPTSSACGADRDRGNPLI